MKAGKWARVWVVLLAGMLVIGLAGFATGCDDDDDDEVGGGAEPEEIDETGGGSVTNLEDGISIVDRGTPWSGTRTGDGGVTPVSFMLRVDGTSLSGNYLDTAGNGGRINGTITGVEVEFDVTIVSGAVGETWAFEGEIEVRSATMTGWLDAGEWKDWVEVSQ